MATSGARALQQIGRRAYRSRSPDVETRVLRYLPTNFSTPEIAGELSLSVHTVRTHVRHLFEKLRAHGRTEAVARARAVGLVAPSPTRPAVF